MKPTIRTTTIPMCLSMLVTMALMPVAFAASTITATDLGYGISGSATNDFAFDFTGEATWGVGSQRSDNGFQNNQRSGRLFVEFLITQEFFDAAIVPGATIELSFSVDAIGAGVAGTPYTDDLDLRFLGSSLENSSVNQLWNSPGLDIPDVLPTTATLGTHTISLGPPPPANVGDWVAIAFLNSTGTSAGPVGNSQAETYAFFLSQEISNYTLTVVPEPSAMLLLGLGTLSLAGRRHRKS